MNLAYIDRAFRASLGLARRDKTAMDGFDVTADGFYRSFFAAAVVLPFYALYLLADRKMGPIIAAYLKAEVREVALLPTAAIESLVYLQNWIAFPLVLGLFARQLRIAHRYVPFIVAYNWSQLIVVLTIVPAILLGLSGIATPATWLALNFASTAFTIYLHCYIAATALQMNMLFAAGIVVFDIALTLSLGQIVRLLYQFT